MEEDLVMRLSQDSDHVTSAMPIDVMLCIKGGTTALDLGFVYPTVNLELPVVRECLNFELREC